MADDVSAAPLDKTLLGIIQIEIGIAIEIKTPWAREKGLMFI
jgi:hypothetical protein